MNNLIIKLPNGITVDLKRSKTETTNADCVSVQVRYAKGFVFKKKTLTIPGKLKDLKLQDIFNAITEVTQR